MKILIISWLSLTSFSCFGQDSNVISLNCIALDKNGKVINDKVPCGHNELLKDFSIGKSNLKEGLCYQVNYGSLFEINCPKVISQSNLVDRSNQEYLDKLKEEEKNRNKIEWTTNKIDGYLVYYLHYNHKIVGSILQNVDGFWEIFMISSQSKWDNLEYAKKELERIVTTNEKTTWNNSIGCNSVVW